MSGVINEWIKRPKIPFPGSPLKPSRKAIQDTCINVYDIFKILPDSTWAGSQFMHLSVNHWYYR